LEGGWGIKYRLAAGIRSDLHTLRSRSSRGFSETERVKNTFTIDYVYDKHQHDILIRTVYIDLMRYAVAFGGSESSSFN
jgi:hypothetical protein